MNEIIFEKKNKDYGAFLLRNVYKRHLFKALTLTVVFFSLGTSAPYLIRHFGLFQKKEVLVLDTTVFILHAPPSINPFEPPKPPPPLAAKVKRPTEQFLEMEAVKKEEILQPPPALKELDKKEIVSDKSNSLDPPLNQDDLLNGTSTTGDGKIWNKVEQPPQFNGGEDAYFQFMSDHLVYPDKEKGDGIEGIARLYFVVNQDGAVEHVKILKTSGNPNLDAEALRLIKIQPNYIPGKQNGRPVKVSCITEIEFKLKSR